MASPPQAAVGEHPRKLGTVNILISKRKAFSVIARVGAGDEWSSEEVGQLGGPKGYSGIQPGQDVKARWDLE